jgi:hypothetical protein
MEVKVLVTEFRAIESRAPRCSEAVACPGLSEGVPQNCSFRLLRSASVKDRFERLADGDDDPLFLFPLATLVLLQADVRAVVLRPIDPD